MTSIPEQYKVETIPAEQTYEWLTRKHYMYRVPQILHAFGLYDGKILQGVCTFGWPARGFNDGYGLFGKDENYKVLTMELNRLVVNEGLPKNALSYFVTQCLGLLPRPSCIVSYADGNAGHHGYIYQATNWLYTGETSPEAIFINRNTGKPIHRRTLSDMIGHVNIDDLPDWVELSKEEVGKFRYLQLLGTKAERKDMRKHLTYPVLDGYPKGDNTRYDASPTVNVQVKLFDIDAGQAASKKSAPKKKKQDDGAIQESLF